MPEAIIRNDGGGAESLASCAKRMPNRQTVIGIVVSFVTLPGVYKGARCKVIGHSRLRGLLSGSEMINSATLLLAQRG